MSLSASLGIATSSLRTIQARLALSSNNIANADNTSYTAKRAHLSPQMSGSSANGVDISEISSRVDSNLVRSIAGANSLNSAAQTFLNYMKSLSNSLGTLSSTGSGDTISSRLTTLQNTLDKLASTPESATLKGQVVTQLDDVAASLRTASADVQRQRANADSEMAQTVTTANEAMRTIASLNTDIVRAKAMGQPTGDLEDQRNAALQTLSGTVDVNSYIDAGGAMKVFTGSGEVLVGSEVHELSFTPTSKVDSSASYPGGLSGVKLNGRDITGSIASGTLSSLITLRDTTLPGVQADLDKVADKLRETVNAAANGGSAVPPPNSLTGTAAHALTDSLGGSGTLRVAITDASGKVVATQDLNLSSYATVGDLVSALNGVPGLSAGLDSSGHLSLKASPATSGVAIGGGTIGGKGASEAFGLNDLLTGKGASDLTIRPELAANSALLPTGTLTNNLAVGAQAVTAGSGTLAKAMADSLRAAGIATTASDVISGVGSAMTAAKSRANAAETSLKSLQSSFSSQYGVNVDEENARLLELQQAYSASSQILSAVKSMFADLLTAVR